ncbi:MAG: hypothetical protein CSA20_03410 [Deltaproteobacteria bacterium]|nr:MAG: hypothetical protein CSB23_02600 [Deltaproteobacteria bacterium]PIE73148.1 MAG: hypothetical protein CSA20_03410 [Deltaproteobacteria bacterium]
MSDQNKQRFLPVLLAKLTAWLIRIWFATFRLSLHYDKTNEAFVRARDGETAIASFWHYSFLFFFYFFRHRTATVMISTSRDGGYIARVAEEFGYVCVRGSRNRGGVRALAGILRSVRDGRSAAMVADGSQGPARKAQPGALLVASKTGHPVIPMAWAASHCLTFNSWDTTAIPLPFARVDVRFGSPIYLPKDLDDRQLESYRQMLEDEINALYAAAWARFGKQSHEE